MKLAKKVATNAKFNRFFTILCLSAFIFIFGCSKDDKPNDPNNPNNNSSWNLQEDDPSLIKLTKLDTEFKKERGYTIIIGKENIPIGYESDFYFLVYLILDITKDKILDDNWKNGWHFWGDMLEGVNEKGEVCYWAYVGTQYEKWQSLKDYLEKKNMDGSWNWILKKGTYNVVYAYYEFYRNNNTGESIVRKITADKNISITLVGKQ